MKRTPDHDSGQLELFGGGQNSATASPPAASELSPRRAAAPDLAEPRVALAEEALPPDVIPARMLNEFVYCPRLFYYEHVEGIFVKSADTLRGEAIHKKVDSGSGAMPSSSPDVPGAGVKSAPRAKTKAKSAEADSNPPETIHSRSVTLGSERHGIIAKMDLVEAEMDGVGGVARVQPVDYKAGAPREGDEGNDLWDTDRMQLGVQCLVLRENGYRCDSGVIYYRATRQRVPMDFTPELERWVLDRIARAREAAAGPIPPPLADSPKCVRCSLAPVCLPDETAFLARREEPSRPPRRLVAPNDERRVLFLNTPGYRVGCNGEVLSVRDKTSLVDEVRLRDVSHVCLFGNIQITTQALHTLCEHDVPVGLFSMGGWFYGLVRGHGLPNVFSRMAQFRAASDPAACLRLAREFVRGKIHNHRVLFMRNHDQPPDHVRLRLAGAKDDASRAASLAELLGVEGAAAAEYFAQFQGMLRPEEPDHLPGLEDEPEPPWARFEFRGRNRRPPTDPVNALLSLAYALLAKECTFAAHAVGLDPYVGFYHQPRHGRPALALDLMEEFRPLVAESAVLTAINNRYVTPADFVTAGRAVNLSVAGRKKFFQCFEQRMTSHVTHPVFDYKVSYRRAIELQFRILARVLDGEIPDYTPFTTR